MRHAGVAARVRNKTCYPLGNGLRWTDPEVIARVVEQTVGNPNGYAERHSIYFFAKFTDSLMKGGLIMTTRQKIDLAREVRLGITQVLIPVAMLATSVLSIPEVREAINEKVKEVKNQAKRKRAIKEKSKLEVVK